MHSKLLFEICRIKLINSYKIKEVIVNKFAIK